MFTFQPAKVFEKIYLSAYWVRENVNSSKMPEYASQYVYDMEIPNIKYSNFPKH